MMQEERKLPYQVVIVEDDPMVAMLNRRYTQKDDRFVVVKEFNRGQPALDYLRFHPVDLLLLDMYMPELSGLELLRQLRSAGVQVDAILITAASDTPTVENAMRLGVVDYLVKPFEYQRFQQALDTFHWRRAAVQCPTMSQQELDGLLHSPTQALPAKAPIPKGLQEKTLALILEFLRQQTQSLTCEQIAHGVGFSVVTVRHYVAYLAQSGQVESQVDYSTGGRPSVLYWLARPHSN
ncbi:response regulator [uncultured Allofournierella sp.]|uniref:response regulator n=1 Tax=uncultured Allofournierella sp. TaxID=1940258 RepID=UPI003752807D